MATNCTLEECHHTGSRAKEDCKRKLRQDRLRDLDQKERLIREERIHLLVQIELDLRRQLES